MEIIIGIVALVIGCLIGYLLASTPKAKLAAQNELLLQSLEKQNEENQQRVAELNVQHQQRVSELNVQHQQQLEDVKATLREQSDQQMTLLREQIKTAGEQMLKERSEQLGRANTEQLSAILNPLKSEIEQMKQTMDKSGREHTVSMERLDASIKANLLQANELSQRADKLAQALIGDNNKTQGDFGELRLKQILEDMGLVEGLQFEEQTTMRDAAGNTIYDTDDGRRLIPDVILHFPDQRDVIIDSKVSLKACVDYQNAENEDERQLALKRHIASVRSHVTELSKKNYSKYIKEGRGKLDFVMMYVFQESALQLALANDTTLWKDAYDSGVIITGSQNLYIMLRVLELTWKQVQQVENQQNIMDCANAIIDRVQMFYERFLKVEEQLDKTRQAFADVKTVTAPSGPSITTAAAKLLKYGAKENPKRKAKLPAATDDTLALE